MAATLPEKLERIPSVPHYKIHHWADYVELLCLVNIDNTISKADLMSRIPKRMDDLHEGNGDDEADVDPDAAPSPAERDDRWQQRIDDWFKHLAYRHQVFGEAYPFILGTNELARRSRLNMRSRLYISLLLSSNLGYAASTLST